MRTIGNESGLTADLRRCPVCKTLALGLEGVIALDGEAVLGRWRCDGCGWTTARHASADSLLEAEREKVLLPHLARMEALERERVGPGE